MAQTPNNTSKGISTNCLSKPRFPRNLSTWGFPLFLRDLRFLVREDDSARLCSYSESTCMKLRRAVRGEQWYALNFSLRLWKVKQCRSYCVLTNKFYTVCHTFSRKEPNWANSTHHVTLTVTRSMCGIVRPGVSPCDGCPTFRGRTVPNNATGHTAAAGCFNLMRSGTVVP